MQFLSLSNAAAKLKKCVKIEKKDYNNNFETVIKEKIEERGKFLNCN